MQDALRGLIKEFFGQEQIRCGVSCPIGWYELVKYTLEYVAFVLKHSKSEATFTVEQIKEKFGGLRLYYYLDTEDEFLKGQVAGFIQYAEGWSFRTCDVCGGSGSRRNTSWIRTLCDEHYEEYLARVESQNPDVPVFKE